MVCFQTKNPNLGKYVEGNILNNVGIFYGHLVYLMAIWYILWSFVIFVGHFYIFSRFGMSYQERSGNPASLRFALVCFLLR
jgi:hypothetical protein